MVGAESDFSCFRNDDKYHGSSSTGTQVIIANAIHKQPKNRGCEIFCRNPKKMDTKKMVVISRSILLNSCFPAIAIVRNTRVGLLANPSHHIIAGLVTLKLV